MAAEQTQPSPAAADAEPRFREVTGYDGSFEEAVEVGLYDKPPPLVWNDWLHYRKISRSLPTTEFDGPGQAYESTRESKVYARVQKHYYGPNYKKLASDYARNHPNWMDQMEADAVP